MLLRRLLSILLLLVTGLPLAAPLLASSVDADAGLPACCRRHGSHHCAMNMATMHTARYATDAGEPQWRSAMQCCRMYDATTATFHADVMRPETSSAIFAAVLSHPAVHAQAETQYRVSHDRTRQKRGPPALFLG